MSSSNKHQALFQSITPVSRALYPRAGQDEVGQREGLCRQGQKAHSQGPSMFCQDLSHWITELKSRRNQWRTLRKSGKAEHSHLSKGASKQQLFLTESSRFHLGMKGLHFLGQSSAQLFSQTLPGADHDSQHVGVVLPETCLL